MENRPVAPDRPTPRKDRIMRRFGILVFVASLLAGSAIVDAAYPAKADDGFVTIFDGKSMDGWKISENPDTFKLVDGAMVAKGKLAHAFYVGDEKPFTNFELKLDIMTRAKANGGVYFHTQWQERGFPRAGFECQVNATHTDPKKSGSLYNIKNVMDTAPHKDDEWWEYHIKVKDKTVTIAVNGKVVTEWTQPEAAAGGGGRRRRPLGDGSSGTFALQAHDPGSEVHYKNIRVKRLD